MKSITITFDMGETESNDALAEDVLDALADIHDRVRPPVWEVEGPE